MSYITWHTISILHTSHTSYWVTTNWVKTYICTKALPPLSISNHPVSLSLRLLLIVFRFNIEPARVRNLKFATSKTLVNFMKKIMFLSKNWYFSVQKALIYYTVNKSHHNSFILLVFSHVANFRYVANFRFLTLYLFGDLNWWRKTVDTISQSRFCNQTSVVSTTFLCLTLWVETIIVFYGPLYSTSKDI